MMGTTLDRQIAKVARTTQCGQFIHLGKTYLLNLQALHSVSNVGYCQITQVAFITRYGHFSHQVKCTY